MVLFDGTEYSVCMCLDTLYRSSWGYGGVSTGYGDEFLQVTPSRSTYIVLLTPYHWVQSQDVCCLSEIPASDVAQPATSNCLVSGTEYSAIGTE